MFMHGHLAYRASGQLVSWMTYEMMLYLIAGCTFLVLFLQAR